MAPSSGNESQPPLPGTSESNPYATLAQESSALAPASNRLEVLYSLVKASTDKFFFVSYVPAGTLRPRWYLVQVDLESLQWHGDCGDPKLTGKYYVTFFDRHPLNASLSDMDSRWWLEWQEYTRSAEDGEIEYGRRILLHPNAKLDPNVYITYSNVLPLGDPAVALIGLFDFLHANTNANGCTRLRQLVSLDIWTWLADVCAESGILPPTLSDVPSVRVRGHKSKRHRQK